MRVLIITLLIAALGVGGFLFYRQSNPAPPPAPLFAEKRAPPRAGAAECEAQNAVYTFANDVRLQLRLKPHPDVAVARVYTEGHAPGNLAFVVRLTSFGQDFTFLPAFANAPVDAPLFMRTLNFVRPEAGGERLPLSLFDKEMRYVTDMPMIGVSAPAYVYIPDLTRALHAHRVDLPPGMFVFSKCDIPTQ